MISDVLSEMVTDVDRFLNNPLFDRMYKGELRGRIIALRNEAHAIMLILDKPIFD